MRQYAHDRTNRVRLALIKRGRGAVGNSVKKVRDAVDRETEYVCTLIFEQFIEMVINGRFEQSQEGLRSVVERIIGEAFSKSLLDEVERVSEADGATISEADKYSLNILILQEHILCIIFEEALRMRLGLEESIEQVSDSLADSIIDRARKSERWKEVYSIPLRVAISATLRAVWTEPVTAAVPFDNRTLALLAMMTCPCLDSHPCGPGEPHIEDLCTQILGKEVISERLRQWIRDHMPLDAIPKR